MTSGELDDDGAPLQLLIKLQADLTSVERIANRVDSIIEAPFMPTAYRVSESAVVIGLLILLFTKIDPYFDGLALFGFGSFLLVSLLLMIRAMDNPFGGYIGVDLSHLYKPEKVPRRG